MDSAGCGNGWDLRIKMSRSCFAQADMKMHLVSVCSGSMVGRIAVEMMLFLCMLSVASVHRVGYDRGGAVWRLRRAGTTA